MSHDKCDFTFAVDRQRLEAVIRDAKRTGLCSTDVPTLTELVDALMTNFLRKYPSIRIIFYMYVTFCLMKQYRLMVSGGDAITENLWTKLLSSFIVPMLYML